MIPLELELRDAMCYKQMRLDVSGLRPGTITAVRGATGAGKSALVESPCALFFLEYPSRGAGPREARVNRWIYPNGMIRGVYRFPGRDLEARVTMSSGGTLEGDLREAGSSTPLCTGKIGSYQQAVAEILDPKEAFYASSFGVADKRFGFGAGMDSGGRFGILYHYLQLALASAICGVANRHVAATGATAVADARQALDRARASRQQAERESLQTASQLEQAQSRLAQSQRALEVLQQAEGRALAGREGAVALAEEVRKYVLPQRPPPMTPVESVTALEQGIEKYRAWTEAKRDCDRKEVALEQARRKQQDNERAASAATTATCKGEGPYAACPLLGVGATALARRQALTDEVKQTEAAFVQARHAMPSAVDLAALGLRPGENDRQALERLRRQAREWAIYQDTHRRYDEAMQRYQAAGGDAVAQVALEAAQKRAGGQQEVEGAQAEVQRLQRAAGALKVALEQSATLVMQAEAREVEVQHEVQQRARWALLAEATGPGGYPSLEIAAAEPEIAAAAGEMLKGPFGERFRVRLATTRVTQAGVEKADCDVEVEDALFPDKVHKSVDGLSKGQRILVEEALRIGLTLFARKRMRTPILTAYRDEPEDGLDAHLVPYYIQMLHRGINLATLHGIWWITHEPLGWDAADAVIDVGSDSRVTLVMGG